MTDTWHKLLREEAFPADDKMVVVVVGWQIIVARTDDGFSAINDRCTHQAARLSAGKLRRGAIMCPLHGARFEVATGLCIGGAYPPLRKFPLRVMEGMIEVAVPDAPPAIDELPTPD